MALRSFIEGVIDELGRDIGIEDADPAQDTNAHSNFSDNMELADTQLETADNSPASLVIAEDPANNTELPITTTIQVAQIDQGLNTATVATPENILEMERMHVQEENCSSTPQSARPITIDPVGFLNRVYSEIVAAATFPLVNAPEPTLDLTDMQLREEVNISTPPLAVAVSTNTGNATSTIAEITSIASTSKEQPYLQEFTPLSFKPNIKRKYYQRIDENNDGDEVFV